MTFLLDNLQLFLVSFVAGVAFALIPGVRRVAQWMTTLVHEIGHALLAVPFGGRPTGIELHMNGSGEAEVAYAGGLLFKPVRIISLMAGYAAPLYLAVLIPYLILSGHGLGAGAILALIGVGSFFLVRNFAGYMIVVLYLILAGTSAMFAHQMLGMSVMFMYVGVLLTRGLWDVVSSGIMVFRGDKVMTDFHLLQKEVFFIPRHVWYFVFLLGHGWLLVQLTLVMYEALTVSM